MEDGQQQSDDEPKKKSEQSSSPKRVGKKLKIDEERWGSIMQVISGQESNSIEKDDNVDSGICAEKSESISSDDPMSTHGNKDKTSLPSTPSTSNVSWTEEVKLSQPKKGRNYRKRSSSLCMSTDSDDDSSHGDKNVVENKNKERAETRLGEDVGTSTSSLPVENTDSRPIVDDVGIETHSVRSEGMSSELTYGINDSDNHNDDDDDHDNGMVENDHDDDDSSLDTDTDVDEWTDVEQSPLNNEDNAEYETPNVLLKRKPDHNWFIIKELMRREIGLGIGPGRAAKNDVLFEQRYYGSLHVVYRLELMYKLNKHKSCVNAINFHPEGDLLASGSDDMNVIIWDWASNSCVQVLKSGHKSNVFQSRFLYLNARSQLNVVSCARDGQVRLIQCPPSGGGPSSIVRRKLTQHTRAAHKLHVWPSEPHLVISAGEDGNVIMSDVRVDDPTKLFRVRDRGTAIPLYSVHGHPIEPRELLIGGQDSFVRVYDRRKVGPNAKPINMYCPSYFLEHQDHNSKKLYSRRRAFYVSCAVYNHNGSEILASYNEDDIYLFDSVTDRYVKDSTNTNSGFSHRYSGHRNSATFKGVAFFGPHSEFVVSGSDCSNIYIWDRKTEAIVQWMLGDEGGVVNCIESHPRCPVLATSGLDKDIKIWVPSNEKDPLLTGLREVIRANKRVEMRSPLFTDFLPTLYSVWGRDAREELGRRDSEEDGTPPYAGNIEFDGNVCTTF